MIRKIYNLFPIGLTLLFIFLSTLLNLSPAQAALPPAISSSPPSRTLLLIEPSIGVLPGLQGIFTGTPPDNLGIIDGHLTPCPSSPNCVVSEGGDEKHTIEPISYTLDRDQAREILLKVLRVVPRTEIIEQTDDYIRVEFTSNLLGFVDDGEFYLPIDNPVIQMRSASRLGESDLGVNRTRLEQIRLAVQDLGIQVYP